MIGLHVRRGELYLVDSDRMLPNEYYIEMAAHVTRACEAAGVAYTIELYTEVRASSTRPLLSRLPPRIEYQQYVVFSYCRSTRWRRSERRSVDSLAARRRLLTSL